MAAVGYEPVGTKLGNSHHGLVPREDTGLSTAAFVRWKVVKAVQLFNGNLVLDCPVPGEFSIKWSMVHRLYETSSLMSDILPWLAIHPNPAT
jgi:hypothetical protein